MPARRIVGDGIVCIAALRCCSAAVRIRLPCGKNRSHHVTKKSKRRPHMETEQQQQQQQQQQRFAITARATTFHCCDHSSSTVCLLMARAALETRTCNARQTFCCVFAKVSSYRTQQAAQQQLTANRASSVLRYISLTVNVRIIVLLIWIQTGYYI